MWDGLLCCVVAAIGFGSVFVPMRRHPMGDGFFAQLFLCLGSFLIVFPVGLWYPPVIYPEAMIGAFLWCFGNSVCVMLMNRVGMAQGMLLWNTTSCLMGWATSRFGFFGVIPQLPQSFTLNYIGVALLITGATCYLFIKSTLSSSSSSTKELEKQDKQVDPESVHVSSIERTIAMGCCVVIGLLFGSFYTPIAYLQSKVDEGYPSTGLDYIFSFFIGVVVTSFLIFIVYCYVKKGKPECDPNIALPAFYGGLMFGASMCFFLVANEKLSPTVAYPIVAMLPGFVVSLWSVIYFKEITGKRNLTLLGVAYALTLRPLKVGDVINVKGKIQNGPYSWACNFEQTFLNNVFIHVVSRNFERKTVFSARPGCCASEWQKRRSPRRTSLHWRCSL
ncbi:unnamed protein product, partial [Mesorhabditis belari]|uniref:Transmembrane protein 144 n=1 Tax=Mesorhabditis belari TaxID=2138241 RepID=A0AAF3FP19_9BILA